MPIDYATGVGIFVPNNAVIMHEDVVKLISDEMKKRGIKHTTSECTLRGFTCSIANVDPKTATPAEIAKIRKIQSRISGGRHYRRPGGPGSNEKVIQIPVDVTAPDLRVKCRLGEGQPRNSDDLPHMRCLHIKRRASDVSCIVQLISIDKCENY